MAINYKSSGIQAAASELPGGIDIYFDSVGGPMLEDALNLLNLRARVVLCGMISVYNDLGGTLVLPPGPNNLLNLTFRRARLEGFVCLDYWHRANEAIEALSGWHRERRIRYRAEVVEGLRNAPRTLNRVFDGTNQGKLLLEL